MCLCQSMGVEVCGPTGGLQHYPSIFTQRNQETVSDQMTKLSEKPRQVIMLTWRNKIYHWKNNTQCPCHAFNCTLSIIALIISFISLSINRVNILYNCRMTPGITKKKVPCFPWILLLYRWNAYSYVTCTRTYTENLKWHQRDYLTCLWMIIFLSSLVHSSIRDH